MTKQYGIMTDYDYGVTHKRSRLTVWEGSFMSQYLGEGYSLPGEDGYMLTLHNGKRIRVTCPTPRNGQNYLQVDKAINTALRKALGDPA
jgi:hypothetical protein